MLAPMSRRWLSRPKTLLVFTASVIALYLIFIHGPSSRYPAPWSNSPGHPDKHVTTPQTDVDDTQRKPDGSSNEDWEASEGEPGDYSSEDGGSVKNKEDLVREQFEREYEELGE